MMLNPNNFVVVISGRDYPLKTIIDQPVMSWGGWRSEGLASVIVVTAVMSFQTRECVIVLGSRADSFQGIPGTAIFSYPMQNVGLISFTSCH